MSKASQQRIQVSRQHILHLRGCALRLLHHLGEWQHIEGYPGRVRAYQDDDLMMLHRTPFQPPPISDAALSAGIPETAQRQAARAYGLDIWYHNRKVMSLVWDEDGGDQVVWFKAGSSNSDQPWDKEQPGPWEDRLESISLQVPPNQ